MNIYFVISTMILIIFDSTKLIQMCDVGDDKVTLCDVSDDELTL